MKTASDPRHIKRIRKFKSLFAQSFIDQEDKGSTLKKVLQNQKEIDKIITKSAPEWPINQINRVDLAILRLSIFELLHKNDIPTKVIIDEAVEIAKRYGSESSGGFINGALAAAIKIIRPKE
jgi:transcription antitermination protein NusB